MKTGIHQLSAEDYHADSTGDVPSLSCSIAKILINQSPAHAWIAHPRLNPAYQDQESASRMDIGTAAHALLLEGKDSVVVCDFDDWRKKEAQVMRDEARAAGKIPLLAGQYADVQAMASIAQHDARHAGFNMAAGKAEQTVIWQEGDTRIRTRPDWLSDDRKLILDYKTTALPNPGAWMRAIPGNGYDVQDALYRRGVAAITGIEPEFVFMVQETTAPYPVYFVSLSAAYREIGHQKVEKALFMWQNCMKTGKWESYPQAVMEAEAPRWALAEAEEMAAERENGGESAEAFDRMMFAGVSKEAFMFGKVAPKERFQK